MGTVSGRNTFTFAGDLNSVSAAREAVMDFVRDHCCLGSDEFDILVAVQEALANAALHGCGNDPSKSIECVVTTEPHHVDIVVTDPGNGFHVEKVADSNALETNFSESGRGISLMRGLMTEVTYHRGGAEVHLKKTLSAARCADTPLVSRLAV